MGPYLGFLEELSTFLARAPQKPLVRPHYMFFLHKKIMSRTCRISGALIVVIYSYYICNLTLIGKYSMFHFFHHKNRYLSTYRTFLNTSLSQYLFMYIYTYKMECGWLFFYTGKTYNCLRNSRHFRPLKMVPSVARGHFGAKLLAQTALASHMLFRGPKKFRLSWPNPSNGPCNGFARIKNITYGGIINHRSINS